ncbi:RtcB family protein [Schlesneria paludicola]|uniref:RtcB family protein n=1 Tax=Schlesneria paludicola TaxID=360056 RepID=UPI00029A86A4|nr:RtcB family protein [Schlesneria paludicola]
MASLQRLVTSDDVRHVAVMPDVHLAGEVCNGTVVATGDLIYPLAVGGDIGCGMLAVAIDLPADAISSDRNAGRVLGDLYARVPSIKHARSSMRQALPECLLDLPLSHSRLEKLKMRDGLLQLGSLGRGNHFVELQSDLDGRMWLMLHSGSRGMGQSITEHHLRATRPSQTKLGYLESTQPSGQAYLSDVAWAIEYAMQNRLAMAVAVESLLRDLFGASTDWSTLIHSHHNHVSREVHGECEYWVHRKGALPASENEPGIIPGSMGTHSYHVSGRGAAESLRSSSHGAGRRFSREDARRRITHREFQRQMRGVWFDQRHLDGLRDEAPAAYKDVDRVMRAQRELTRIVRRVRPLLTYKGS